MANVILDDTYLFNIADAIREKNGTDDTYTPDEMADAIVALPSGGGNLAHATLTHNTGGTSYAYRTFDLTNYITSGNIYFITHYGSGSQPSAFVCIIENGTLTGSYYGSSGSIFNSSAAILSTPKFELTNGVIKITGSSSSYVKNTADVIYIA